MAKFEALLAPGGLLVANTSLIEAEPGRSDIEVAAIPCTALARTAGHDRLASVVALGALVARRPIVGRDAVRAALEELTRKHPDLLEADLAAFDAGMAAATSAAETAGAAPGATAG
jgi:2-oxoglutarate ferredoxin oxidoreductase subunit gamma